eukprot:CAMPEP_0180343220 /NCGR_PEP_ID=MMETSP0989-20121125/2159_1 /TAXON_ID=697907 /ORGANISM="non described non described, Strain CCMP2293" /LENGTH=73 /DNA_ID=CAMNT_0022332141 /DNA_START=149 /DNA_END=366 /DNA_ORIENTATION=+
MPRQAQPCLAPPFPWNHQQTLDAAGLPAPSRARKAPAKWPGEHNGAMAPSSYCQEDPAAAAAAPQLPRSVDRP